MRVRVNSLTLVGGNRTVQFDSGLNIVAGPISSGKTTLLRFCRILLGSPITNIPREARDIGVVNGSLSIGPSEYMISRPVVGTSTARVDIAGPDEAVRLPALRRDQTADRTFGIWLLQKLGLPVLDVPSAPTQPDSSPTPVSVNDYFSYSVLSQDQIQSAVFGHNDPFRNIKRKYVFDIIYGSYNVEVARLQEDYRDIQSRLRAINVDRNVLDRLFHDTPLENRAEIERELNALLRRKSQIESEGKQLAESANQTPRIQTLHVEIRDLDDRIAESQTQRNHSDATVAQLQTLLAQLTTQSARLTRSIAAGNYLLDFEFMICPRCGTSLNHDRGTDDICRLCMQQSEPALTREDLVREQDAVGDHIVETRDLIDMNKTTVERLDRQISLSLRERQEKADTLDVVTESFISDSADRIAQDAHQKAELDARIRQLRDYVSLVDKLDSSAGENSRLQAERDRLVAEIEAETSRTTERESRIRQLETTFREILEAFRIPEFIDPSRATIDRETYLPVLDGRKFNELSSDGLKVLVNVAHALAHQRNSISLDLSLPNILLIDDLTAHVGSEGLDTQRVSAIYEELIKTSEEVGDVLQIIVAENRVIPEAESYVKLRLSEDDRLVRGEA